MNEQRFSELQKFVKSGFFEKLEPKDYAIYFSGVAATKRIKTIYPSVADTISMCTNIFNALVYHDLDPSDFFKCIDEFLSTRSTANFSDLMLPWFLCPIIKTLYIEPLFRQIITTQASTETIQRYDHLNILIHTLDQGGSYREV